MPLVVVGGFGQYVTCPIAPYNRTDWVQGELCKLWVHISCNKLKSVPKQYVCPGCVHRGLSTHDILRGEDTYLKNMDTQRQLIKGLPEGTYGKGAAGEFRVYMAELGDSTPTLQRTIGERFLGTFHASCIIVLLLNRIIAFLQGKVRNGDSSPWWSSLLCWAQAPSKCLFVMMGTGLHAWLAKLFFKEFHAGGIVCVAAAHPYVLQPKRHCVHRPWIPTSLCNLRAKATVQTHPLLPILLRRLRIVFCVMSEQWEQYTVAYRNCGALDRTSLPDLSALKETSCTSALEEIFFGALSDQWKLMGPTAALWRVTPTAFSRVNASVDMSLLEEDVPQLIHRAARVEEMHGRCVRKFCIQLAKSKQDDIVQAQRQKKEAKPARQQAEPQTAHAREERAKAKQPGPAPKRRERAPDTHTAYQARRRVVASKHRLS